LAVVVFAIALGAVGCGGADIPMHSGYKNDKLKPWKKPKVIPLDEKGEGKVDGELNYAEYKRAKWYAVDLPADGELDVNIEISPPGDAADEDFDLAMEVLDPNFQVISKADLDEEDAHEVIKNRALYDLAPGRYLIHLYLQRRIDTAEYDLKVHYIAQARAFESDFPAQVQFPPRLATVPPLDDTPADQIRIAKKNTVKRTGKGRTKEPKPPPEDKGQKISAHVINVAVSGSESVITIDRGTNQGVSDGMKAYVKGVPGGVTLNSCGERNCKAKVNATPDQISSNGGKVTIVVAGSQ
jgi:hypothetical protein